MWSYPSGMAIHVPLSSTASGRPFGSGLRDMDLRLMVASTDVRYRQKLKAVIVRRERSANAMGTALLAAELVVVNSPDNIAVLQEEAHMLDPHKRLRALAGGAITDIVLESATTGERVMITAMNAEDFRRVESVAVLEQIHIGTAAEDRGSWVCRLIDAERLDALFGGTIIDIRH